MYTIGAFLEDLCESPVWYKILINSVDRDATIDLLHRHIIPEFWNLKLLCGGFTMEKTNDEYYLGVMVDFNDDEIDIDEENFQFEELPIADFSQVFRLDGITIPKKFKDNVTYIDGSEYKNIEVEFVFDSFSANNDKMLPYIKVK
jgi:hypothetical protein